MHTDDRPRGHHALRRGRVSLPLHVYHITTVTLDRCPLFARFAAARALARCLESAETRQELSTLAWCLMPDHLHWLIQLGESLPLKTVLQRFKSRSAVAINRTLQRTGPVWAASFHDHALRRDEDLDVVTRYVIENPLRAGLVKQLGDYPYWNTHPLVSLPL